MKPTVRHKIKKREHALEAPYVSVLAPADNKDISEPTPWLAPALCRDSESEHRPTDLVPEAASGRGITEPALLERCE
jgi:hypothetical protein